MIVLFVVLVERMIIKYFEVIGKSNLSMVRGF